MRLNSFFFASETDSQSNSIVDVKFIQNLHGEINRVNLLKLNEGIFITDMDLIDVPEFLKHVQYISLIELLLDFGVVTGGDTVNFQYGNSLA